MDQERLVLVWPSILKKKAWCNFQLWRWCSSVNVDLNSSLKTRPSSKMPCPHRVSLYLPEYKIQSGFVLLGQSSTAGNIRIHSKLNIHSKLTCVVGRDPPSGFWLLAVGRLLDFAKFVWLPGEGGKYDNPLRNCTESADQQIRISFLSGHHWISYLKSKKAQHKSIYGKNTTESTSCNSWE